MIFLQMYRHSGHERTLLHDEDSTCINRNLPATACYRGAPMTEMGHERRAGRPLAVSPCPLSPETAGKIV